MKTYLIKADIGEGYPYYTFMLNAKNQKEAEKEAKRIVKADYKEQWEHSYITVEEVKTMADIKNELVI